MMDEFNQYRNKNGYIDLNKIPDKYFYDSQSGRIEVYETMNDVYYYRHNLWARDDIREIINQEIAKQVECENAEYDLATLKGSIGIITRSFIGEKEIFKNGMDFLYSSPYKRTENTLYNYLLALKKRNVPKERIQEICRGMLENHILDIFSLQEDRSLYNLGFLEKAGNIRLAPRLDNEMSFLHDINSKINPFLEAPNKKQYIIEKMPLRLKVIDQNQFRLLSTIDLNDPIIDYWESSTWKTIPTAKKQDMVKNISLQSRNSSMKETYKTIQKEMKKMNSYIERASQMNFEEIYYHLKQYNIGLSEAEKEFFKLLYQTRVEMFFEQKQKIKNR